MDLVGGIVAEMLDDDGGLLLIDEATGLEDEIFGITFVLAATVSNIGAMRWHKSWRDGLGLGSRSA